MKNVKVNLTLPQEIVDMLDELKGNYHLSKAAIITIAVTEYFRKIKREEKEIESEK